VGAIQSKTSRRDFFRFFIGRLLSFSSSGLTAWRGLRSRLRSPETTVQELEGARAVITLGTWPETGNQEPERTLAPYRELARLLELWLFPDRSSWRGFTLENMRRWECRFLD